MQWMFVNMFATLRTCTVHTGRPRVIKPRFYIYIHNACVCNVCGFLLSIYRDKYIQRDHTVCTTSMYETHKLII